MTTKSKKKVPFVHSNYDRIADDNYQTIDHRCVQALVDKWNIYGDIVDCCSPQGSGIVDALISLGHMARGVPDAFAETIIADYEVTNPPYDKKIVDKIIYRQIDRIADGEIFGFIALLRANFDFAKTRRPMFSENRYYTGQIKMCFRPIWIEPNPDEKQISPIHNYSWYIWTKEPFEHHIVRYWYEN